MTISHAFLKAPVYNFEQKKMDQSCHKSETLHLVLKTYGYQPVGGARRTGKSVIFIYKNNTDSSLKNLKSTLDLKLKSQKMELQTQSNELLFYQEFKDEIIDLMVVEDKVLLWGVAFFGIISIYETKYLTKDADGCGATRFRAKLCYEKTFCNMLTKRILPLNERYVVLIPFRPEADVLLYNVLTDHYNVVRFGSIKNK